MRHRRYTGPHSDYEIVKRLLGDAFKLLRREGFIARQNFLCCQTCAGYELATRIGDMPEQKRKKVKGVVYYHNQDNTNLKERGSVYLAYGPVDTARHGEIGLHGVEVGRAVVKALEAVGLAYEWDGLDSTRILVKAKQ
jgi:hypothetical protein